ncbi:sugar transferase [Colwellia psychrerythraea]|uniref:Undecaprenyl-phosphate galactose phosphotransferase n=1 Tax=Colwellia psychrerythraea TaxID=28229 RepID=A0A099K8K4_COLPS|nr:sugar transferase [Colwellia psychrerythraea]KGJ86661.1 Undecaprenyl-phosphate galactose phosphotransferase [Colwellia psychrerythraea]
MTIQTLLQVKNNALFTGTQKTKEKNYRHKGIPVILQQTVALIALLFISPLLLLVFILIKAESSGSALFSQTRVGENGRHFKMYKFRSMYLSTDPKYQEPDPAQSSREGVCKKYINDPRITKIGQFIRKYSIDEIPQLFNIVRGDMCLVGPRPALSIETYEYDNVVQTRLFTKPGLTGLWQVSGRADTNFEEQLQLDRRYIKQQSFLMDCKIIVLTIPAVLSAKGAY